MTLLVMGCSLVTRQGIADCFMKAGFNGNAVEKGQDDDYEDDGSETSNATSSLTNHNDRGGRGSCDSWSGY